MKRTTGVTGALRRAARELERAARFYEKDNADLYARVLTPGGTRVDRETRLSQARSALERLSGTVGGPRSQEEIQLLGVALSLVRSLEREERGEVAS